MSLTGANSVIMLAVTGVFDTPQQLQGYAADDVFDADMLQQAETLMGVDGKLSGGFVFKEVDQTFALQADSASNDFFDAWKNAQEAAHDVFTSQGIITLFTLGSKWTMRNGFLTGYTPIPAVKKLVQPRKYKITWESMTRVPS